VAVGVAMTRADWADPDALAVALYTDGCDDPDGPPTGTWLADDDFLVLVNAWADTTSGRGKTKSAGLLTGL